MHLYLSALAISCYMTLLVFAVHNPDCWVKFVISMFVSPQDKLGFFCSYFWLCIFSLKVLLGNLMLCSVLLES